MIGQSTSSTSAPSEVSVLAELLPAGLHIAAMSPADADEEQLHPLESLLIAGAPVQRKREFAAGRLCAARLLRRWTDDSSPLLAKRNGAPDWPDSVRGSISHKAELCVAAAGLSATWSGIGLDVEESRDLPAPAFDRVLTPHERDYVAWSPSCEQAARARLFFSAKECYYKWYRSQGGPLEPDFQDVEVSLVGASLRVRAVEQRLPDVTGCFVVGDRWQITALWSEAIPPRKVSQLEAEKHGNIYRSAFYT